MNTRTHPQQRRFTTRGTALLGLGILLATVIAGPALSAAAVDDGNLGIRPSNESDFFHLSVRPGEKINAIAIVSNHTAKVMTLLTYPVDGLTTSAGAFALKAQNDARTQVGSWTSVANDQLVVQPKADLKVPFTISVPAGTRPGDYSGALIIQSPPVKGSTQKTNGTDVRIDVVQRQGVRIYLNVTGKAVVTMSTGALRYDTVGSRLTLTLPVTNTGNTTLHPSGVITLNRWFSGTSTTVFSAPESVPPGATVNLTAWAPTLSPVQIGSARATVSSAAGKSGVETTLFTVPWPILVGVILLGALVALALTLTIRFVRKARRALAELAKQQDQREHHGTTDRGIELTGGQDSPPRE